MRCTLGIVALALIICPVSVDAGTRQPTAIMTISGVPGQFTVQVDQTDWSQIQGMPDPRAPSVYGPSNPLSSRGSSPLTSRGGGGGAFGVARYVESRDHNLAVLAELLLRGPQTPGELRTRANRMRSIASLDERMSPRS